MKQVLTASNFLMDCYPLEQWRRVASILSYPRVAVFIKISIAVEQCTVHKKRSQHPLPFTTMTLHIER